jgi:hypothetical protein
MICDYLLIVAFHVHIYTLDKIRFQNLYIPGFIFSQHHISCLHFVGQNKQFDDHCQEEDIHNFIIHFQSCITANGKWKKACFKLTSTCNHNL